MILSGKEIAAKQGKELIINPFDPKRVNPNSYNLRLFLLTIFYTYRAWNERRKK